MSSTSAEPAGRVSAMFITPKKGEPACALDTAELVTNYGLAGDAHARPNSDRQLLLMDAETLRDLDLTAGVLKENITTVGIPLRDLPSGQRLLVGSAVVELTKGCPPCADLNEIRPGLQRELVGRRGVLARVISGGTVLVGDEIALVGTVPDAS
jgi:MOSC domain-containing protein YiiM